MATTNTSLVEGSQLTTSAASYYTSPANTTTIVKKCTVTNTSAGALTVTIYLVPSGGSAGATNTVTSAKSIAAGATYEAYECENHVLLAGDTLQALASAASSLTLKASGIQIV
jgi:hypothetical protein